MSHKAILVVLKLMCSGCSCVFFGKHNRNDGKGFWRQLEWTKKRTVIVIQNLTCHGRKRLAYILLLKGQVKMCWSHASILCRGCVLYCDCIGKWWREDVAERGSIKIQTWYLQGHMMVSSVVTCRTFTNICCPSLLFFRTRLKVDMGLVLVP